jgi:hypothetical protein
MNICVILAQHTLSDVAAKGIETSYLETICSAYEGLVFTATFPYRLSYRGLVGQVYVATI